AAALRLTLSLHAALPICGDARLLHDPAKGSPLKALFQEFLPGRLKDPLLCSLLFFHGLPPLCILPLPAGNSLRCCGPFHIGPSRSEAHTSDLQSRFELVC